MTRTADPADLARRISMGETGETLLEDLASLFGMGLPHACPASDFATDLAASAWMADILGVDFAAALRMASFGLEAGEARTPQQQSFFFTRQVAVAVLRAAA